MKRLIIPAVSFLLTTQVLSQDILTMRSGAKYEVKLLEINDHDLRFRMHNNPEGPLYIITRNSFASIRYENGVTEELALQSSGDPQSVAINGFNTSDAASSSVTDQSATLSAADDYALPTYQPPVMEKKKTTFGDVLGAILVTGMIALDVAAKVEMSKCTHRHTHSHCSNR